MAVEETPPPRHYQLPGLEEAQTPTQLSVFHSMLKTHHLGVLFTNRTYNDFQKSMRCQAGYRPVILVTWDAETAASVVQDWVTELKTILQTSARFNLKKKK